MKIRSWFALGGFAAFGVGACASTPAADKFPDTASFCSQKALEECQPDTVVSKCGVSSDACVAQRKGLCLDFVNSATTGKRHYQASSAQACIDKTHEIFAKTSPITVDDLNAQVDACNRVFPGNGQSLQACSGPYDCSGDLICDKSLCFAKTVKNTGDLCGNPGDVCNPAVAFCTAAAGGAMQCVARKGMGEACNPASAPCLPSLRCDNTCQARFPSGAPCASNDDCAASAGYCDKRNSSKCGAGLSFAAGAFDCKDFGG